MNRVIFLAVSLILFSVGHAAAQSQPTYEDMMTQSLRLCLLGMGVEISSEGDAGIRLLRRGVAGDFTIRREEYPSILDRLDQELKGEFTRDSRECVERNVEQINRYFLERDRLERSDRTEDDPIESYLPRPEVTAQVNGQEPNADIMSGLESAFFGGLAAEHQDDITRLHFTVPRAGHQSQRMARTDQMGLCPGRAFGTINSHVAELSAEVIAKTGNRFVTDASVTLVDCSDDDQNNISRQVLFAAAENAGCAFSASLNGDRISRSDRHVQVSARPLTFVGNPEPIQIPLPACR